MFLIFFSKFPVFSLSGKMDFQIPCFPCAVATLYNHAFTTCFITKPQGGQIGLNEFGPHFGDCVIISSGCKIRNNWKIHGPHNED